MKFINRFLSENVSITYEQRSNILRKIKKLKYILKSDNLLMEYSKDFFLHSFFLPDILTSGCDTSAKRCIAAFNRRIYI